MMGPAAFKVTQLKADRRDREPFRTPVPSAPDPRVGPAGDGIRGEAVPAAGNSINIKFKGFFVFTARPGWPPHAIRG